MEISGSRTVPVDQEQIWETLLKVDVLESSIPGMEQLERQNDTFSGTLVQKLAGISVEIDAEVKITEDNRPDSMQFSIEGTDNRINSRVDGSALVTISPADDTATTLEYESDFDFSGKLASLGSRLIKRQVNNVIDQFFSNLMDYFEDDEDAR